MLFSIVTTDSGSTMSFNIVDNFEQCEEENLVNPVSTKP